MQFCAVLKAVKFTDDPEKCNFEGSKIRSDLFGRHLQVIRHETGRDGTPLVTFRAGADTSYWLVVSGTKPVDSDWGASCGMLNTVTVKAEQLSPPSPSLVPPEAGEASLVLPAVFCEFEPCISPCTLKHNNSRLFKHLSAQ